MQWECILREEVYMRMMVWTNKEVSPKQLGSSNLNSIAG